jgi:glycogen(starch) synthase
MKKQLRVMYAGGPGDVVLAHQDWQRREETVSEVSRTFSGQVADCCESLGASLWFISSNPRREILRCGAFIIENRPKRFENCDGVFWHVSQFIYAMRLFASALAFRADVIVVDSGTTTWFFLTIFRLFGIRVIPMMHNALWPTGFRPEGLRQYWIQVLDGWFWRRIADATIAVSGTCLEQVMQVAGAIGPRGPLLECRHQFVEAFFEPIEAPSGDRSCFNIMFAGRITRDKGVFDILEIAKKVEQILPGRCRWELCGDGPAIEELRDQVGAAGLEGVVKILGRLDRHKMADAYGRSHVVIVPTRGDSRFSEGLPLVIAEAILAGRPVITSRITNALEAVGESIVEVEPQNLQQYVHAIERLIQDANLYQSKQSSTNGLRRQFVDGERGLANVLREAFVAIGLVLPSEKSVGNSVARTNRFPIS